MSSSQVAGVSFFGGSFEWTTGHLHSAPGLAVAINQIINFLPHPAGIDASGTVVLEAAVAGSFSVAFNLDTADYFGATPGAPALFTVVPEPTSAGLLALGLLGLSISSRLER